MSTALLVEVEVLREALRESQRTVHELRYKLARLEFQIQTMKIEAARRARENGEKV